jgi:Flp pilus assembly protein TadG
VPAFRFLRARRFASSFARADRGATAVEFGLIALPFFILLFGLLELTLVFLVSTTLETATEVASRQVRTGEFQQASAHGKSDFKALVCGNMSWLAARCSTDLDLDVQTFSSFSAMAGNAPIAGASFNTTPPQCFTAGGPGDIVLVRVYYRWRLFTPLLNNALQNMGSGSGMRLLSSATAFRNEPYDESPPLGAKC